jgi:hypothetical protein
MKHAFSTTHRAALALFVAAGLAMAPLAQAAGNRGGGGHGGGHAGAAGARSKPQVNHSRTDVRANNVRSTSVNNVNVNKNVNVNVDRGGCCNHGWDNDYHPIATAAAVTATVAVTSAVVGSIVRSVPANCVPVNYGGMIYQQCGSTWYQPQGGQYVVINPPY